MGDAFGWARKEFGGADLGDARRAHRLVRLAKRLAESPGSTVSGVCRNAAERQGAYDLLSNSAVRSAALLDATGAATAARCAEHKFVYVPIDGTSLTLIDRAKKKPLGSIGAKEFPTRGLKVVDAVAVSPNGTLEGVLDVQFWARSTTKKSTSRYRRRKQRDTEMRHWSAAVDSVRDVLATHAPDVQPWFVMDRESDEAAMLRELGAAGALFTIRAAQNRVVECRGKRRKLFSAVRASKLLGTRVLHLPRTPKRAARVAKVVIRATSLKLMLPTYARRGERVSLEVGVVEVREVSTRRNPLHWVLLTSCPVATLTEAERVVDSYRARWRIEEFHRTWKAGGCDAENIHLRSAEGIRKWAILLAAVAARTERLKYLARNQPDEPATIELTEDEIAALIYAKRRIKTRVEDVPDEIPTIRTAARWIADLGGYAGHYKGYEPGATTISRGLAKLAVLVEPVRELREALKEAPKKR